VENLAKLRENMVWIVKKQVEDLKVSIKESRLSIVITRSEARVKCSKNKVVEMICNGEYTKCQPLVIFKEELERFDEIHADYYLISKMPFPFSKRDWVNTRWISDEPEETRVLVYSIDRSDRPISKKYVRGTTFASVFIIRSDPKDSNYSLLDILHHTDAGGRVPLWMSNLVWKSVFKTMKILKSKMESST